jgi:hypothetical protein
MPATPSKTIKAPAERTVANKSWLEHLLSTRLAPIVIIFFALLLALTWANADNSLPVHDASWHCAISTAFRQWICKPSQWRLDTLLPLVTTQPLYPAGVWAFNGLCKVFVGDSLYSEHFILAIHLLILNISSFVLSKVLLGDRAKACLTIFILNSCPLVLALSHVALIDLAHTAFVAAFLCAVSLWWRDQTWGRAALCGILWGTALISKQIALFYTAPVLGIMGIILLYKRSFRSVLQVLLIGAIGTLLLSTWLIPNLKAILYFSHDRTGYGLSKIGFFSGLCKNFKITIFQIVQSFSPFMFLTLLLLSFQLNLSELRRLWIAIAAPLIGAAIIVVSTFWANPEPRYYAPVLLTGSFLLASALINFSRKFKAGTSILCAFVLVCILQTILTCSQQRPVLAQGSYTQNPVFSFFGLREEAILRQLAYTAKGDSWKQEWLIDYIETCDLGRPSYVNLLMNSSEFNEGTLVSLAHSKHANVFMTSWRASEANLADSFKYTDEALNSMQWVVAKTGSQGAPFFDEMSKKNYDEVLFKLKNNGFYIEETRQKLPDGSELILYRNKRYIWPRVKSFKSK